LEAASRLATNVEEHQTDQELVTFLGELREEVIEVYITVLLAAADAQCLPLYGQHINSIFDFLERSFRIDGFTNIRVVRQAVALVGDVASHFPGDEVVKGRACAPHIEQQI
jgi:hypothetical protein